jgi:signal transduction histidine kinase
MPAAAGATNSRRSFFRAGDTRRPLFENLRRIVHAHVLATDTLMAACLLALSTGWLVWARSASWDTSLVQLAIIAPLIWRRSQPTVTFCVMSAIGVAQWGLGYRLIGDAALLVALYTVAVHESRARALLATAIMETGAVMAATRWHPAGAAPRSFLFLTATVVAALFAGFTVRSGSEYMGWLAERAERLEIERDQQASLGAAAERARIAREMHDIVAHSLSVVVTLADAASIVSRSDPAKASEAMEQVSSVGRQALADMRTLIGVLRTDIAEAGAGESTLAETGIGEPGIGRADLAPLPTIDQLDELFDRVRRTGLEVTVERLGQPFAIGAAAELSLYRIVQEALTNTLKHAGATKVSVVLRYANPSIQLDVIDNGTPSDPVSAAESLGLGGHGIEGMRERASLHSGTLWAGPHESGGWMVSAAVSDTAPAPS